jgi:glucose-6-phosphate 1-dehydrogenase
MKLVFLFSYIFLVFAETDSITFIILGASGDLAKRKIYPALFSLYAEGLLPPTWNIVGYARSALTNDQLRERIKPFLLTKDETLENVFFQNVFYIQGSYDKPQDYEHLNTELKRIEKDQPSNRIFYLSLPPNVFLDSATYLNKLCRTSKGYNRIIIEKPFGRNSQTFRELSEGLNLSFAPEEIYRIDHFLGKEVVQNVNFLRFENSIFEPLWDNSHIKSIQIIFKEKIDIEGRGGYFDSYGMIRDVVQNHLMQILALVCMDRPASLSSKDIITEKVKLLKDIQTLSTEDLVVAQYQGYTEDPTVNPKSTSETFAALVLHINNKRWKGVPIVMKAGKALNERVLEIIVQFKDTDLFSNHTNELIIRVQPDESIYLNILSKVPGYKDEIMPVRLNLSYKTFNSTIPEAYARLLYDVTQGKSSNFVTEEEISLCWNIFDDALAKLEQIKGKPAQYIYGGNGPIEARQLVEKYNLQWSDETPITVNADPIKN